MNKVILTDNPAPHSLGGIPHDIWDVIQDILSDFPQVKKAILFGSRARKDFNATSDIDIALVGDEIDSGILNEIANRLDDLLLIQEIDILHWNKIKNPHLAEHIKKFGIIFYHNE